MFLADTCVTFDLPVFVLRVADSSTHRLEPNDFGNILRVVLPDIGVFIVAVTVYVACRKLCPKPDEDTLVARNLSEVSRCVAVFVLGACVCRLVARQSDKSSRYGH